MTITWENHIKERMSIGHFDTEDYVILLLRRGNVVRIANVASLACAPSMMIITSDEIPEIEIDEIKIIMGDVNPLSQRMEPQTVSGQFRAKLRRPLDH